MINKSSINLDEKEENLLNKGLNFALHHKNFPTKEIIVDVETMNINFNHKNQIISKVENVLKMK